MDRFHVRQYFHGPAFKRSGDKYDKIKLYDRHKNKYEVQKVWEP